MPTAVPRPSSASSDSGMAHRRSVVQQPPARILELSDSRFLGFSEAARTLGSDLGFVEAAWILGFSDSAELSSSSAKPSGFARMCYCQGRVSSKKPRFFKKSVKTAVPGDRNPPGALVLTKLIEWYRFGIGDKTHMFVLVFIVRRVCCVLLGSTEAAWKIPRQFHAGAQNVP